MPIEEFLLPKESIEYTGPEQVEYQGSIYNFYITNLRLILHHRKGLLFKKERVVSERLLEIQSAHFKQKEPGVKKGILTIETSQKKMDIIGNEDNIKAILHTLQKHKKIAEETMSASLYVENWLVQNETVARSLAKIIWREANNCCVCGRERVSLWVLRGVHMKNGIVILARLFCREHEKKWKKGERLNYEKFNGLMLLEKLYQKPVGMWSNISMSKFMNLMKAPIGDNDYARRLRKGTVSLDTFECLFQYRSDLIFRGRIEDFLEAGK